MSMEQMAELFQRDKSTISRHIKNIFTEGELQQLPMMEKIESLALDDKHCIKFKLPIIEEDMNVGLDNDSHIEIMVMLSCKKD